MTQKNLVTISKARIERLLREWANLPGEWPMEEGDLQYKNFFGEKDHKGALDRLLARYPELDWENSDPHGILLMRELLRKLWRTRDARYADWYVFKFRDQAQKMGERIRLVRSGSGFSPLPLVIPATLQEVKWMIEHSDPSELTPLEIVGQYLSNIEKWMRVCSNPECVSPFYIARKRASKYCSADCALPAQRASKLRWWRENRREKPRKSKGKKRRPVPGLRARIYEAARPPSNA
jgi:hypothetical protein